MALSVTPASASKIILDAYQMAACISEDEKATYETIRLSHARLFCVGFATVLYEYSRREALGRQTSIRPCTCRCLSNACRTSAGGRSQFVWSTNMRSIRLSARTVLSQHPVALGYLRSRRVVHPDHFSTTSRRDRPSPC